MIWWIRKSLVGITFGGLWGFPGPKKEGRFMGVPRADPKYRHNLSLMDLRDEKKSDGIAEVTTW